MKLTTWIATGALAIPLISAAALADDQDNQDQNKSDQSEKSGQIKNEQDVKMSDLPSDVKDTAQREAQGKHIGWMKKGTQDGKTVYEFQILSSNGKGQKLVISGQGKVLERKPLQQGQDPSSATEHED